jgi:hypothetical protein
MWVRLKYRILSWGSAFAISGSVLAVFYCLEQAGLVFALSKWATVFWLGAVSARLGGDIGKSPVGKKNSNS